jgi:hypothetical protein
MNMAEGLGLESRFIGVVAGCLLWAYFMFRAPAAVAFIGVALVGGLGSQPTIAGLRYGALVSMMQVCTVAWLLFKAAQNRKLRRLGLLLAHKESVFLAAILLIWIKIAFDCFLYGLSAPRVLSMRVGANIALLPAAITLLAFVNFPRERVVTDLIKGWMAFSLAHMLPILPTLLHGSAISSAIHGESRLNTYGNLGGGIFLLGFTGLLVSILQPDRSRQQKIVYAAGMLVLFLAMLLNATRQNLFGVAVALGALLCLSLREGRFSKAILLFVLAISFYVARNVFSEASVVQRVSFTTMRSDSRFDIWNDNFSRMLDSPWRGVGFRNSGKVEYRIDPGSGAVVESQDDAHGFFQDAFCEHGVPLGSALLGAFLLVLYLVGFNQSIPKLHRGFLACLLGLCAPGIFSGTICKSSAYYLFGVAALGISAGSVLASQRVALGAAYQPAIRGGGLPALALVPQGWAIGHKTNQIRGTSAIRMAIRSRRWMWQLRTRRAPVAARAIRPDRSRSGAHD